ncbi:MAG: redoxin domain-containing protein [Bacteroidetes bacterium]|nr:redoxin domain-containing protein [Bacteroidota bacterium]
MHKIILLAFLFSLNFLTSKATTITSNNLEYAGKTLDFFKYSDPITQERIPVFSLNFNTEGKCSELVNTKITTYVFCDFGIYQGMLFLEPNQTITLKLPPLREKSFADQKNPYFSPVAFWFATENKTQLNNQISNFTQEINHLTDKFFNQIYFQHSREIYDSVTFLLGEKFSELKSETFINHKLLHLKMVEVDAFRQKPADYSNIFPSIKSNFWIHPSFISLFEKTFSKQLSFEAKAIKGQKIGAAVNNANLPFLLDQVKTKYKIDGNTAELALLKMLHDGFYSGDFSKIAIKEMVKNTVFAQNTNQIIKDAALRISQKFDFLQTGFAAPTICLKNLNGDEYCTNSNKDKFKYLIFADTEMIVCREHLKYLASIQQRFQKHLEIIIVLRNTDLNEMKTFLANSKIQGVKLLDKTNKYIDEYKIRSFPQCFLLDENHKVKFVSAKSPLDGFEQQFGPFLQQELFQRQRNQSR